MANGEVGLPAIAQNPQRKRKNHSGESSMAAEKKKDVDFELSDSPPSYKIRQKRKKKKTNLEAEAENDKVNTPSSSVSIARSPKKRKKKNKKKSTSENQTEKQLKTVGKEVEQEEEPEAGARTKNDQMGNLFSGSVSGEKTGKKSKKRRSIGVADGEDGVEVEPDEVEFGRAALTGDVCQFLMERYKPSSAPQHRHLCASAAAMRSLLLDEGLPLTPAAYFAAAVSAVCGVDEADSEALSALSGFLSVLLPHVSPESVPPRQAVEAASSVVALLESLAGEGMAAPTVRSLVGCLGLLAQSVDLEDWVSVELPLWTLLRFSLDRRPKVRRCAQLSVVKVFGALKSPSVIESSSNSVLSLFQRHIPLAMKLSSARVDSSSKDLEKSDNIEVLHVLNIVKILVAHMPLSIARTCLPEVSKILNGNFSVLTRNGIGLLEVILLKLSGDILPNEAEAVLVLLTSFLSPKKRNPGDILISASTLLRDTLNLLHNSQPEVWTRHFSSVFRSMAGLLISSSGKGKHFADILKDLISIGFLHTDKLSKDVQLMETDNIISMCSSLYSILSKSSRAPNEHILAVVSDLFHKLGKSSSSYMSEIVLKLSSWVTSLGEGTNEKKNVQQCLGSAIESMGPENILSILPFSFDPENKSYSNMWLIPILKKHTSGASLQYFLDHIVPLVRSAEDKLVKARRSSTKKKLVSSVDAFWSLLPAFCRYPTDLADSYGSLAKILVQRLEKNENSYELVSMAIKELVNGNKDQVEDYANISAGEAVYTPMCYPREVARKNLEVLALNSMEIIKLFIDIFFASAPEKRVSIKDIIRCLASILDRGDLKNLFSVLPAKYGFVACGGSEIELEYHTLPDDDGVEEKMRLMVEISSAFVQGSDQDFIVMLFNFIKPHLMDDGLCQLEGYEALREIIKGCPWFVFSHFDQLMDLLMTIDSMVDPPVLSCRLSCLHLMFVHLLKENEVGENNRALLILNEILRLLKDSNEEVRKTTFDTLLNISQTLKEDSSSTDVHHRQLFQMIMGYLSGSPPQIMSVAIAAISLLIYEDSNLFYLVPDLIPTVLMLLQNKANEVIKAVLGLIKVMASRLPITEIRNLLPNLINGILPWSSVSKNHFRTKVKFIFEILLRKCGHDAVLLHTPDSYRGFVNLVIESKTKANTGAAPLNVEFHTKNSFNARKFTRKVDPNKNPRGQKRRLQHPVEETPGEQFNKSGHEQVNHKPKRNKYDSLAENQTNNNRFKLKNKVKPAGKKLFMKKKKGLVTS
ncbi:ARM repeat superfamily protein [Wolffia australiana]